MTDYDQNVVQLHRQALNYMTMLYTPYRAFSTLIRHLGLLDSQKLWFRLVKYLSIVKKTRVDKVIEYFNESEDVRTI